MRATLLGLAALGLVGVANAGDKQPPVQTDEAYQIKIVNESGADVLLRAVSFNRNWDAIEVKKGETFSAADERHYFRKGQKVFIAYDLAAHKLIAVKEVDVTGPIVVTVTAKNLSTGPLAEK